MVPVIINPLLMIPVHHLQNSGDLMRRFFLIGYELVHEEVFTYQHPFLINNVIKLSILRIKNVFLIVVILFFIFVLVIDLVFTFGCVYGLYAVFCVSVKLVFSVAVQLF